MNIITITDTLTKLYTPFFNEAPLRLIPLPASASARMYFRIESNNQKALGAFNANVIENNAFFYLAQKLKQAGVRVPEIYAISEGATCYILEDLGDTTLYQFVEKQAKQGNWAKVEQMYKKVIAAMPAIQYNAAAQIDFTKCFPRAAFDRQSIEWDLHYFKYLFLKIAHVDFDEQKLEDDFRALTDFLLDAPAQFFMFRDFQSRNIMLFNDEPYFIDFQGGRQGALQYDLASLLFEGKTNLPNALRESLLEHYLSVFSGYDFFQKDEFLRYYPAYALVRMLQAFGAYGYRGIVEQKAFFVQSIPHGIQNIKYLLANYELDCPVPYLKDLLLHESFDIEGLDERTINPKELTVKVHSFSYKKGLPVDYSGHGGGYLFDARCLPNPGRLDAFRNLTGETNEVEGYLLEQEATHTYYQSVCSLIFQAMDTYLDRNFTYLSIGFGCTGGQHRSVFLAKKMATELSKRYSVRVILAHRELNKEYIYEQTPLQTGKAGSQKD